MNKRQYIKNKRKENKKLVERFPFLMPRNVWTDKEIKDYNYDWTYLDDMPVGWKKAFGILLCEELKDELIKFDFLDKYRLLQVKEKYASLRWYDNGYPVGSKISDIVSKYEFISQFVCMECGKIDSPEIYDRWCYVYCERDWLNLKKRYLLCRKKYQKDLNIDEELKNYTFDKMNIDVNKYICPDVYSYNVNINISETVKKIRSKFKY